MIYEITIRYEYFTQKYFSLGRYLTAQILWAILQIACSPAVSTEFQRLPLNINIAGR